MSALIIRAPATISNPLDGTPVLPDIETGQIWLYDASRLNLLDGSSVTSWPSSAGSAGVSANLNQASSSPPTFAGNILGQGIHAVRFNRANQQYIRTSSEIAIGKFSMPVTIAALVLFDSTSTGLMSNISSGRKSTAYMALGKSTSEKPFAGAGAASEISGDTYLSKDNWVFLAAVYDGVNSFLYVETARTPGQMGVGNPSAAILEGLTLGASATGNGSWLGGLIAEHVGYARALSREDVEALRYKMRSSRGLAV